MQNEPEVKGNVNVLIYPFGEQVHRLKYCTLPSFFLSSTTRKRLEGRERGDAVMLRIRLEQLGSEARGGSLWPAFIAFSALYQWAAAA
jgi:hypothetical protein